MPLSSDTQSYSHGNEGNEHGANARRRGWHHRYELAPQQIRVNTGSDADTDQLGRRSYPCWMLTIAGLDDNTGLHQASDTSQAIVVLLP